MKHQALVAALAIGAQAAHAQSRLVSRDDTGGGTTSAEARPTILLVHGAFVDGSGWEGVYKRLRNDGFKVTIVQNPTTSLSDDVAATRRAIDESNGRVILVGHSYGGVVITQAGNDPRVAGLVYIAAFAPDDGESAGQLNARPVAGAPVPPILPPREGFLLLDRTKFPAAFAADVEASRAEFMAESQVPWALDAANGAVTEAAWKSRPSWYLVAKDDHMIPPETQRFMSRRARATVVEASGSHALYVSHPEPVAKLIVQAATALSATAAK